MALFDPKLQNTLTTGVSIKEPILEKKTDWGAVGEGIVGAVEAGYDMATDYVANELAGGASSVQEAMDLTPEDSSLDDELGDTFASISRMVAQGGNPAKANALVDKITKEEVRKNPWAADKIYKKRAEFFGSSRSGAGSYFKEPKMEKSFLQKEQEKDVSRAIEAGVISAFDYDQSDPDYFNKMAADVEAERAKSRQIYKNADSIVSNINTINDDLIVKIQKTINEVKQTGAIPVWLQKLGAVDMDSLPSVLQNFVLKNQRGLVDILRQKGGSEEQIKTALDNFKAVENSFSLETIRSQLKGDTTTGYYQNLAARSTASLTVEENAYKTAQLPQKYEAQSAEAQLKIEEARVKLAQLGLKEEADKNMFLASTEASKVKFVNSRVYTKLLAHPEIGPMLSGTYDPEGEGLQILQLSQIMNNDEKYKRIVVGAIRESYAEAGLPTPDYDVLLSQGNTMFAQAVGGSGSADNIEYSDPAAWAEMTTERAVELSVKDGELGIDTQENYNEAAKKLAYKVSDAFKTSFKEAFDEVLPEGVAKNPSAYSASIDVEVTPSGMMRFVINDEYFSQRGAVPRGEVEQIVEVLNNDESTKKGLRAIRNIVAYQTGGTAVDENYVALAREYMKISGVGIKSKIVSEKRQPMTGIAANPQLEDALGAETRELAKRVAEGL